MNINNIVNNLNFKKIIFIILIVLATNWAIHEVIFWSYFHEFQQNVKNFNTQFLQDQQSIHNKIVELENASDKWNKEFDKQQNDFHASVDKTMKENIDFIQNSHTQIMDQQKQFDKKFEEMPEKMWKAHKEFSQQSLAAFEENSKKMDEIQDKQFKKTNDNDRYRKRHEKLSIDSREKQYWEEARIRYHDIHGIWLPSYEIAFKKNNS
jgi:hypothetical protein